MNSGEARYSMDTSAILDGLRRYYPRTTFVTLWEHIDGIVQEGRLFFSEEVLEELKRRDDHARQWVEERKEPILVPTNAQVTATVTDILQQFPKLTKGRKGRNRADAFVIAVGELRGCTVITGEGQDGNYNKTKIPFICRERGIPCADFLNMIQSEGWQY